MSTTSAPQLTIHTLRDHSSNTLITGGEHYYFQHDDGLANLYQYISPSMLHDSRHRSHTFKCDPEKLRNAAGKIQEWFEVDRSRERGALFQLHGGSRTQRTAIAQAMANHYYQSIPSPLLAAIFINDKSIHQVITTIAYQLALAIPETRPHIIRAMEEDPAIVDRQLKKQCEWLILEPLRRACVNATPFERQRWPNLIILEGLGDCVRDDPDFQPILHEPLTFLDFPLAILTTCQLPSNLGLCPDSDAEGASWLISLDLGSPRVLPRGMLLIGISIFFLDLDDCTRLSARGSDRSIKPRLCKSLFRTNILMGLFQ